MEHLALALAQLFLNLRLDLVLSDEVAAAFWVPITHLTAPGASITSTVRAHGLELRVPSFVHEGHTIWGMTDRVLRQLLALLG